MIVLRSKIKNDFGYCNTHSSSLCIIHHVQSSVNASTADLSSSEANDSSSSPNVTSACVTFNSEERMMAISCKTTDLTQIDNQLKDSDVIHKDAYIDKGWILNA